MGSIIILSLKEVSKELEVSIDTLRNWLKQGIVKQPITKCQISDIKDQLVAQGKLSSRANKLYKRGRDESEGAKDIVANWEQYESSLDESHRNREGIYYTPVAIVNNMMSKVPAGDLSERIYLDPCCGSGNFLVAALEMGFKPENIYGFDTDPTAVSIAKSRVVGANIECGDFLEIASKLTIRFDYIYTNPPWGKRLSEELRKKYTQLYGAPRSADTTGLFYAAARRVLRKGGFMGLLVQEAVFNIGTFSWMREDMLSLKVKCMKDYGRPFRGLMTKAQGIVIENLAAESRDFCECYFDGGFHIRRVSTFVTNPKTVMNFWSTASDMKVIEAIYSIPCSLLKGRVRWGLGIVTGDNRRHCSPVPSPEFSVGVVKGNDIVNGEIQEPSLFINGDLSRYQQCAPREIYEADEKLIYRFISKRLHFCVDRQQRYLLNSVNCVVLGRDFGASCEQVAKLLNSDVMNWLFNSLFHSHKVLRSDIEILPIHTEYFNLHQEFDEETYCNYLGIKKIGNSYKALLNQK